jgi:prevent-host-death family protein
MIKVNVHEAKTNLSKLIAKVEAGEVVILCKGNHPVAKIVGLMEPKSRPTTAVITSKPVRYSEDCFAPLNDAELKEWGI